MYFVWGYSYVRTYIVDINSWSMFFFKIIEAAILWALYWYFGIVDKIIIMSMSSHMGEGSHISKNKAAIEQ